MTLTHELEIEILRAHGYTVADAAHWLSAAYDVMDQIIGDCCHAGCTAAKAAAWETECELRHRSRLARIADVFKDDTAFYAGPKRIDVFTPLWSFSKVDADDVGAALEHFGIDLPASAREMLERLAWAASNRARCISA